MYHTNARYQKGKLQGGEGACKNSVLPAQFFHKTKISLKKFFLFFMATALGGVRGLAFLGLSHSLTM